MHFTTSHLLYVLRTYHTRVVHKCALVIYNGLAIISSASICVISTLHSTRPKIFRSFLLLKQQKGIFTITVFRIDENSRISQSAR